MSIVPLSKVTLCGLAREKPRVLAALQECGCMHLVSLRPPPKEPEKAAPARPEDAYRALRYLTEYPNRRRQVREAEGFDVDAVVAEVLANKDCTRALSDRRDFLAKRIRDLEPWGDFRMPPGEALAGLKLWFYIVPHDKVRALPRKGLPWAVVHRDNRHAYVVAIARTEPPRESMPVPRTRTGAVPRSELQRELERVELRLEDLAAERASLTRWTYLLTDNLARAEDAAALHHAAEQTLDTGELFAIQGWVACDAALALGAFAAGHDLAFLEEAPGPDDAPPTLLENPAELAGGEDLVAFFQTPGYRGWDPSLVLFFSFSLFFAMILSDAGYAGALLLVLALYWPRLGRSGRGRRLRTLAVAMLGTAMVYGVLAGSYFGVTPPTEGVLGRLHLLDVKDFDAMLRLSVVIGVLHVALANAFMVWQRRGQATALAPMGWVLVLFGGLALWLGPGEATWADSLGTSFVTGGLVAVLLFSSDRRWACPADLGLRLVDGLQGVVRVTSAFGDVLSYLRLFALGLASASLAVTFNELARDVQTAMPGIGLLLALLILLLGHALNLALGVMSGVVHGLRLNFIEFYNWGVSEEGYPFRAFAKREVRT